MMNVEPKPEVYIVLINYNNSTDTIRCLESLQTILYPNASIILIDNASEDKSLEVITTWMGRNAHPYSVINVNEKTDRFANRITIIRSRSNTGFGGACNIGLLLAKKHEVPYVLLLNNDTIVENNFLNHMISTMLAKEHTGAVGAKIFYLAESNRIWYCGGSIKLLTGTAHHDTKDRSADFETTFVTGCAMLLNMQMIDDIGLFDERYFLNVEDWDLSYRIRSAGWTMHVSSRAIIYHKTSGSIGGSNTFQHLYYFHRNRLLFYTKFTNGLSKIVLFMFQFIILLPTWSLLQIIRGNFVGLKALKFGLRDFRMGNFGRYNGD
jgi:GT2 family glycosyltransferase